MAKKAPKSKKSQNPSSSGASASANKSIERVSARGMVLRIKTGEGTRRSSRQLSSVAGEKDKRPNLAIKGRTQTKKKKKKKKKKKGKSDPKMPKKPPTAFFFFLEDFRKEFQEQNPDVKSMRDIGKACGEKWKIMTYEEKVKYYDIATEKRAEFDRSVAEYIKRKESGEDNESESDSEFDE